MTQATNTAAPVGVATSDNFDTEVLNATVPVLVDVWAAWCGPCRMVAPMLDTVASEYAGRIRILKLDADAHRDVVANYGVQGLPTLLLFKDGKEVNRIVGAPALPALREKVDELLTD